MFKPLTANWLAQFVNRARAEEQPVRTVREEAAKKNQIVGTPVDRSDPPN